MNSMKCVYYYYPTDCRLWHERVIGNAVETVLRSEWLDTYAEWGILNSAVSQFVVLRANIFQVLIMLNKTLLVTVFACVEVTCKRPWLYYIHMRTRCVYTISRHKLE